MTDIFDKFDKTIDTKGLAADVKEAAENGGGDFADVPKGTYEVALEKLELGESKKGDPMAICWFKITEGQYKGQMIFYYQVITQGFQIHLVNELLRAMDTGIEIEFENYRQYNDRLLDVAEKAEGLVFALEYGENKKGYSTYKITDVFETE